MDVLARLFDPTPPEHTISWDMLSFSTAYTLHASVLEEIRFSPSGGVIIRMSWDLIWNPGIPRNYPNLAIVFPLAYSLHWTQGSWRQATIDGATSELVTASERERMLSDGSIETQAFQNGQDEIQACVFDESLTRTVFQGMNWSRITILHGAEVRFLCFDDSGSGFPIPKIIARPATAE